LIPFNKRGTERLEEQALIQHPDKSELLVRFKSNVYLKKVQKDYAKKSSRGEVWAVAKELKNG